MTVRTESAVLLIIYRRADLAASAIEALRTVKPARLYVAADGPRTDRPSDPADCAAARQVVLDAVTWECDLRLRFRDQNLGVEHGVVDAIDWFFENEEQGIVLEDDIIATPDFFRFCDELLERYRHDQRVASIGGMSYWRGPASASYHASSFVDMWGWATWRDRWQNYDATMSAWPRFADSGRLSLMPGASPRFVRYWRNIMDQTKAGLMQAWDYQWILTCWDRGQISLHPAIPLVTNLGFDARATNTKQRKPPRYCRPAQRMAFPLQHALTLVPDPAREKAMWSFRFSISARDALVWQVKRPLVRLRDGFVRGFRDNCAP